MRESNLYIVQYAAVRRSVRDVSLKVDVTTPGVCSIARSDLGMRPRPDLSQVPDGNKANTATDT